MKKMICLLLLLSLCCQPFAQTKPSQKQELWQKSKNQRTTAWILLGTGAIVSVIGLAVATTNVWVDIISGRENVRGPGAWIGGVSLMAGSIPFFIMAGKNRRLSLAATSFQTLAAKNNAPLLTLRRGPGVQVTFIQKLF